VSSELLLAGAGTAPEATLEHIRIAFEVWLWKIHAFTSNYTRALVKTLKENYPEHRIGFMLGFLDDKDVNGFLHEIKSVASVVWTISIEAPRGITAEDACAHVRAVGLDAVPVDGSRGRALAREWASAESNRLICVTGSLYLAQLFG